MKSNLTGFVFSVFIHLIFLLLLLLIVTKKPAEKTSLETQHVLSLAMFKESSPVKPAPKSMEIQSRSNKKVRKTAKNWTEKGHQFNTQTKIQTQDKKQLNNKLSKFKSSGSSFSQKQIKDIEYLLMPPLNSLGGAPQKLAKHSPNKMMNEQQSARSKPKRFTALPKPTIVMTKKQGNRPTPQPSSAKSETAYKAHLQQLISASKIYPPRAKRRKDEGLVKVSFVISAKGVISQVQVVQSSGSKILDEAAIETLKKISGKLPFPREIRKVQWSLMLPIRYQLNKHK